MAEQPEAPQTAEEGNLTIAALQTISNIIDIAMTRGAFRANEARSVGEAFDKISAFLQNVQKQAEEQQTQQPTDMPPGDAGITSVPENN